MSARVSITGNTYPVRDQLRALGGRWNSGTTAWEVPAERADEARRIVASAGAPTTRAAQCGTFRRATVMCGYCGGPYPRGGLCPRCGDEG